MALAAGGRGVASEARYSRAAIAFHWIIAALLVANLLLGLYHEDVGREARSWMMFFHKADGLLILASPSRG
jgi:cytochrome b561